MDDDKPPKPPPTPTPLPTPAVVTPESRAIGGENKQKKYSDKTFIPK